MLADLLLAYLCAGLAAALMAGVRFCRKLSTHRSPERRVMLRALDDTELPRSVCVLLFGLGMLAVLLEVAVFWPARIGDFLREEW